MIDEKPLDILHNINQLIELKNLQNVSYDKSFWLTEFF